MPRNARPGVPDAVPGLADADTDTPVESDPSEGVEAIYQLLVQIGEAIDEGRGATAESVVRDLEDVDAVEFADVFGFEGDEDADPEDAFDELLAALETVAENLATVAEATGLKRADLPAKPSETRKGLADMLGLQ